MTSILTLPKITISDNIISKRAALAGIIGPVWWSLLLVLLDVIQYDFLRSIGANPLTTSPASENGVGPYGWLYMINDFVFGLLVIAFGLGLRRAVKPGLWTKLGIGFLLAFGAGFVFGAAPCDCIEGQPTTWFGLVHNIASYVLLISTIPMSLFLGLGFRHDPRWRSYAGYSIATGVLALPLFVVANALPEVFSWFYLWLLFIPLGWIEVTAIRLWRLSQNKV